MENNSQSSNTKSSSNEFKFSSLKIIDSPGKRDNDIAQKTRSLQESDDYLQVCAMHKPQAADGLDPGRA